MMNRRETRNWHQRTLLAASILLLAASAASGQPGESVLDLQDARFKLNRLAPGSAVGEALFQVDEATLLEFVVTSTIPSITTSIQTPTGEVVDEFNVGTFGGEFAAFAGGGNDSSLIAISSTPGFHSVYSLPSLGPGSYRVVFMADPNLAEEVPVLTQLTTDSPLKAGLLATNPEVVLGDLAVLTAAVFDSDVPAGASVQATIRDPQGNCSTLNLLDDGLEADDSAEDGLFSGEFEPQVTGEFSALADIVGTTPGGVPYVRQAAATFRVVPVSSRLTGAFSDTGVDDNGNGLFDRVRLNVETETTEAGDYRLFAELTTAGGQTLQRTAEAALTPGANPVAVDFEAAALRALGEDGPYRISRLELVLLGPEGASLSDRIRDIGSTQGYLLSQLERPGLILTGSNSDRGVDTDGNGRFNRLEVNLEVDVATGGFYQWSLSLADSAQQEIAFASNSAFLSAGTVHIQANFPGLTIGNSRINGPYVLRDFLMFGAGTSLVNPTVGQTQAYLANQFESSNLPPEADAGPDQIVECQSLSGASVALDGRGSSDPDGGDLTFAWTGPFGTVNGPTPTVDLPLGVHVVSLQVEDESGETDTDTVQITVEDTTAPVIENVSADPNTLGLPNHKMRPVVLAVVANDLCDPSPSCRILEVTSNEPEDGLGGGDTSPDWEITGDLTVNLRAERSGTGIGRVYTLTVGCSDASGNASSAEVMVAVPHNQ